MPTPNRASSTRALPIRALLSAVLGESKSCCGSSNAKAPPLDIIESTDHFRIDASLPGFQKDEITLEVEDGVLRLTAKRTREATPEDRCCTLLRTERYAGPVCREIRLPDHADGATLTAQLEDGVLSIFLPKPALPPTHRIAIN